MANYDVFGPFEVPRDEYGNIARPLTQFWTDLDRAEPGLSTAIGVYVFLIKTTGGQALTPWYVGSTQGNANGFRGECFEHHKRTCYTEAMSRYKRAVPHLLFIARLSASGGRFSHNRNVADVEFVENYCIGLAINANPQIINRKNTLHYSTVRVPGILNNSGNPGKSARILRSAFGLDR